jgi:predicted signal transduction protein with EAL and GGDEF domain
VRPSGLGVQRGRELGRGLRLATIAEGIETQAQRNALLEMGCDYGQGYLFSRPLPANGVTVLLQSTLSHIPTQRGPSPLELGPLEFGPDGIELAAGA